MSPEDEALAAEALRPYGPIVEAESLEGPLDGPATVFHAEHATAWVVSPARARAEARGREAGHRLAPEILSATERVIVMPRVGAPPVHPAAALRSAQAGDVERTATTLRALLDSPETRADRALARAGLKRGVIERLLSTTITIETERGPALGGLLPGWLRTDRASGRPIAISVHRAQERSFPAMDLAALTALGGPDLRAAHRNAAESAARDRIFDAFVLRALLRELVHGEGDEAEAHGLALDLMPDAPSVVRVEVSAPPEVELSRFAPLGDGVPASHARFLLRTLDGRSLAGSIVRVRTTPELRAGRARGAWEPRAVREARIDPRFSELRFDDEALFSATPRAIADEIASHAVGVALDGTAGAGMLTLALARRPEVREVVACELDRRRLAMACHNAEVSSLSDRIRFVHGDVREVLAAVRPDTLVLDPPWGGREYDRARTTFADLGIDLPPLLSAHAGTVILKLPPSFDVAELPAGFRARVLFDERAIPKCLLAVRPSPG